MSTGVACGLTLRKKVLFGMIMKRIFNVRSIKRERKKRLTLLIVCMEFVQNVSEFSEASFVLLQQNT